METRKGTSTSQTTAAEYYKNIHVNDKSPSFADRFKDIDDAANFQHYQKLLLTADTKNFVLDFGDDDAWCAVNLDQDEFGALANETVRLLFLVCGLITDGHACIETKNLWDEMDVSFGLRCQFYYVMETIILTVKAIYGHPRRKKS